MSAFHHPEHRAKADSQQEPIGFCDACGTAVYKTDQITVSEHQLLLTLHGSCASIVETKIGHALYAKAHGMVQWDR